MPSATIIGANYAGLMAAKKLLKQGIDITIISPDENYYSNPAAPRLLVEPGKFKEATQLISHALKNFTYTFVKGTATDLNPSENYVTVQTPTGDKKVEYENLIIATGSRAVTAYLKPAGSLANIEKEILAVNEKLQTAKSVAIIGAGMSGVEIAGEIATEFKSVKVDLYNGASRVLPTLGEKHSTKAAQKLGDLGVSIINNVKVESSTETSVTVNNEVKNYDVVIISSGLTPNSEFIPKELLDDKGYLVTNEYFQVPDHTNIYGLGDILAMGSRSIVDLMMYQLALFEKVAEKYIAKKDITVKAYKAPTSDTSLVPVGRTGGVGVLFGWGIPNFLVKMLKSKTFMIEKVKDYYDQF